jgi:hypothetical protein
MGLSENEAKIFGLPANSARARLWLSSLFFLYALLSALAVTPFWPVWFWYHPTAMIVGFCACMGPATLMKKVGGRVATKYHGYGMAMGTLAAMFGWYVIHSNKDANGKPHFTTVHGKVGFACLIITLASAMGGSVFLDPDFGLMKASKRIRGVHRYAGRGILALAAVASLMGWWTVVKGDLVTMLLIAAPLPALGWALL